MSSHDSDLELIRALAALLKETDLGEIEYKVDARTIRLSRGTSTPALVVMLGGASSMPFASPPMVPQVPVAVAPVAIDDAAHPGAVKSPMVGTAYLCPEPGKPSFVKVGDKVSAGQTVLIIEAMKTFNPIKAPHAGTVAKIVIGNAQPVEFGEVLLIVE